MKAPAIFRLVTNGRRYAIQRKADPMSEWEFVETYPIARAACSPPLYVPVTYLFKFRARWKMCQLMLQEHEERSKPVLKWIPTP